MNLFKIAGVLGIAQISLAVVISVASCLTPQQAGQVTQAACTLVQSQTDSGVVESICATAPELAEILALVAGTSADAGARKASRPLSLAEAIHQVKAARK